MKNKKASVPDTFSPVYHKSCTDVLDQLLTRAIQKIYVGGGGGEILNLHRRKIVVIHNHGKVHADVSTMMDLDLFPSKTIGVCDAGWIHPDQSKFILYRDLSQNIRKPLNFTQYI